MNMSKAQWRNSGVAAALLLCAVAGAPHAAVLPSAADAQAHQHAIANALALASQVQGRVTDYR